MRTRTPSAGGGAARDPGVGHAGPLADPVVVELDGAENIAVGAVPWGLGAWVHPAASAGSRPGWRAATRHGSR